MPHDADIDAFIIIFIIIYFHIIYLFISLHYLLRYIRLFHFHYIADNFRYADATPCRLMLIYLSIPPDAIDAALMIIFIFIYWYLQIFSDIIYWLLRWWCLYIYCRCRWYLSSSILLIMMMMPWWFCCCRFADTCLLWYFLRFLIDADCRRHSDTPAADAIYADIFDAADIFFDFYFLFDADDDDDYFSFDIYFIFAAIIYWLFSLIFSLPADAEHADEILPMILRRHWCWWWLFRCFRWCRCWLRSWCRFLMMPRWYAYAIIIVRLLFSLLMIIYISLITMMIIYYADARLRLLMMPLMLAAWWCRRFALLLPIRRWFAADDACRQLIYYYWCHLLYLLMMFSYFLSAFALMMMLSAVIIFFRRCCCRWCFRFMMPDYFRHADAIWFSFIIDADAILLMPFFSFRFQPCHTMSPGSSACQQCQYAIFAIRFSMIFWWCFLCHADFHIDDYAISLHTYAIDIVDDAGYAAAAMPMLPYAATLLLPPFDDWFRRFRFSLRWWYLFSIDIILYYYSYWRRQRILLRLLLIIFAIYLLLLIIYDDICHYLFFPLLLPSCRWCRWWCHDAILFDAAMPPPHAFAIDASPLMPLFLWCWWRIDYYWWFHLFIFSFDWYCHFDAADADYAAWCHDVSWCHYYDIIDAIDADDVDDVIDYLFITLIIDDAELPDI